MDTKDILAVILSSTVLTTIITTVVNFFSKKRQYSIENITKERKEWRSQLRKVAKLIAKAEDLEKLKLSLSDLIVRINAYGVANNTLLADSFFWEKIQELYSIKGGSLSKEELDGYKIVLINHISCILKFDWERSKGEIKGSTQSRIVYITLFICYIFSVLHFGYISITQTSLLVMPELLPFTIHYVLLVGFSSAVVFCADKCRSRLRIYFFVVTSVITGLYLLRFMSIAYYHITPHGNKSLIECIKSIPFILWIAPHVALLYASEIKLLNYLKNRRDFVLSAVISSGQTIIDRKYKVLFFAFPKKYLVNRCTGEELKFSVSESRVKIISALIERLIEKVKKVGKRSKPDAK